jgi:hypothetical protein
MNDDGCFTDDVSYFSDKVIENSGIDGEYTNNVAHYMNVESYCY